MGKGVQSTSMLAVVTLILLALVLQAPLTTEPSTTAIHHRRTVQVPEDHHSIAEALASSQPNDRILIGPGPVYGIQSFSLDGPNLKVRLGPPSHH